MPAKSPVERMAAIMAAVAAHDDDGACTREALLEHGFTPAEIDAHKDAARARAARIRAAGRAAERVLGQPDPIKARKRAAAARARAAATARPAWSPGFLEA